MAPRAVKVHAVAGYKPAAGLSPVHADASPHLIPGARVALREADEKYPGAEGIIMAFGLKDGEVWYDVRLFADDKKVVRCRKENLQ